MYVDFKGKSNITFFAFLIGADLSFDDVSIGISSLGLHNEVGSHDLSSIRTDAKLTIVSDIKHHSLGPDEIPRHNLVSIYAISAITVMHNHAHFACQ